MIDYLASFVNTDGSAFPDTLAVNATGAGTGDGTEIVKLFVDDLWGARQALLDAAGLTPDGVTEAPDTSQLLEAIRRISGSPGEGVIWWKSSDPAVTGDRVLLLTGQVILIANYPELVAATYCGDGNNPTASAFFKTSDAGGTVRDTAGGYFVLPDSRGYALRHLDPSGAIDPEGASRDIGSLQDDALQKITGQVTQIVTNSTPADSGALSLTSTASNRGTASTNDGEYTIDFDNSQSISPNAAKTDDDESRMKNIATKFGIRY